MKRRTLDLDPQQRETLEEMRDHHPDPVLRERAAALLKIADGISPYAVALNELAEPQAPTTVYEWLDRYQAHGIAGLYPRVRRRTLDLDPWQRKTLEEMRDHHPIPYLRERAAALLKIADGMSPHAVAQHGLLKPRKPDTVYEWLDHYEQFGIAGLYQKPRRQRDISPEQVDELEQTVHQDPRLFGIDRTRWTLEAIRQALTWLKDYSVSGIWRLLQALKIRYKRGRESVHSPDPEYSVKRMTAEGWVAAARLRPNRVVTYYLDEFSFYRQPTVAQAWHRMGSSQPLAQRSHRSNTYHRVIGALDVHTGRVVFRMASRTDVKLICAFLRQLRQIHPNRDVAIAVILDNWYNVHDHPDVQRTAAEEGIKLIYLPTYAPWLNPIEKLWRKAYQEVLHLHRLSDRWAELKQRMRAFFEQFADGSPSLLRYVGLLPD